MNDENNNIEQQLKYIYRKLNERTAISNISNFSNVSQRLTDGNINIDIDTVNKVINFGYGSNKIFMNVKNKTINNIQRIVFQNSQLNGLINKDNLNNLKDKPNNYSNYAASAEILGEFMNDVNDNYAAKEHTHEIEEIIDLEDALDGKASVNHTHAISDVTNLQTTLNGNFLLLIIHI